MAVDSVENKSNLKVFENIVDQDGHKRFIEGDIEVSTISGLTKTYGKWSLSGTHLMIVVALVLANGSTISSYLTSGIALPKWIVDKCATLWGNNISAQSFNAYASDQTTQSITAILDKDNDLNTLNIYVGSPTLTENRNVRIQFDLLIDNE